MTRTYLDYNATCPIRPEVIDAMVSVLRDPGNASSIHAAGRQARKIVEDARGEVAKLVSVRPAQIVFNSGATEGNNQILSGYKDKPILVSSVEHPSVLEAAPHAIHIPVSNDGTIDINAYADLLNTHRPALVAIQLVNSETGVIQPLAILADMAHKNGALLLCDAVQAAGRVPLSFSETGADFMTLSAHKFGGPQGTGALIFREGLQFPKLLHGGGQERRQRAGTENVAAIHGFGIAARIARENIPAYQEKARAFQSRLEAALKDCTPVTRITGADAPRVANTTNVILPGISAETQLMAMDLDGICVSSGSACSSGTFKPSHVLAAMGYGDDAKSALRISTGWATTDAEIDACIAAYARMAQRLKK